MSFSSLLRSPPFNTFLILSAFGANTYFTKRYFEVKEQQSDARYDEFEGTLRGHLGLLEDQLDRIEGKKSPEGRVENLYTGRGKEGAVEDIKS